MNEKKCYYYYLLSRKEKKNIMKKQRRLIRFLLFIWRGTSHPSVERNVKKKHLRREQSKQNSNP